MFIGRKKELEVINTRLDSGDFELGVIYGQRRIGKTSVILESLKGREHIYFLARQDNYQRNLDYFTEECVRCFSIPYPVRFGSFDALFDFVIDRAKGKKFAIVIDELPFLAKSYPGIVSYLQKVSDDCKREGRPIKIILSGSDSSFMVDLLSDKAKPLYQRATFKIHVKPMVFSDAARMLEGFSSVDAASYLAIFGNRPYYLEKLSKDKTFERNLIDLCFDSSSILVDAPNMTLPIGYSSNSTFVSILTTISDHKQRVKEIADVLHIDDNALSTFLKRMLAGESIEKRETFNGNRKTVYYEISDPFIRFYYRAIYPNLPNIERGLGAEVYHSILPVIENAVSRGFEDVVNSYMDELNGEGKLPHVYNQFKKFTADNSPLGRSVEIDGLADSLDGRHLLAIEAKFKSKNLSKEVLDHLIESVSLFAGKYESVHYCLFSKTGFSEDLLSLNDRSVSLVSLDDMLGGKEP